MRKNKTTEVRSSSPFSLPKGRSSARSASAFLENLPGAVAAPLPERLAPQLGTLSRKAPTTGEWIYEIKFDGYRILTRLEAGSARLFTRNGHDWSARMKPLAQDFEACAVQSAWLDGEVVVMNSDGIPDFNALQNAFDGARTESIVYFLFDVPTSMATTCVGYRCMPVVPFSSNWSRQTGRSECGTATTSLGTQRACSRVRAR